MAYHKEARLDHKLKAVWTQHLKSEKDKEEFKQILLNSRYTFGRLKEIVQERQQTIDSAELTISDFDSPNWAAKQAYRSGQRSILRFVEDLLNFA